MIENTNMRIELNVALAYELGMFVPEVIFLSHLDAQKRAEIAGDTGWQSIQSIAIKRVAGIPITVSAFWDGEKFSLYTLSIQDKNLLAGGKGPLLNANLITIFPGRIVLCDSYFSSLGDVLKKREPEYRGFVNFEVRLDDTKVWYQRIIFGATYDFLYCLAELYGKNIDDLIQDPPAGGEGFTSSLRVYSYPYDPMENKKNIESLVTDILCAEGDESYIVCRRGENIKNSWQAIYDDLAKGHMDGICYRVDGGGAARGIYHNLKRGRYV